MTFRDAIAAGVRSGLVRFPDPNAPHPSATAIKKRLKRIKPPKQK